MKTNYSQTLMKPVIQLDNHWAYITFILDSMQPCSSWDNLNVFK
jgi:hypothetical protein